MARKQTRRSITVSLLLGEKLDAYAAAIGKRPTSIVEAVLRNKLGLPPQLTAQERSRAVHCTEMTTRIRELIDQGMNEDQIVLITGVKRYRVRTITARYINKIVSEETDKK